MLGTHRPAAAVQSRPIKGENLGKILCVLLILGVREVTVEGRVIQSEVCSCFIETLFIYSFTEQRESFWLSLESYQEQISPLVMQMQVFGSDSQQHANKLELNTEK